MSTGGRDAFIDFAHNDVMPTLQLKDIAAHVGGELVGDGSLTITGAQTLDLAQPGDITFIGEAKYVAGWAGSRASAALVDQKLTVEPSEGRAIIKVKNADLAMAQLLDLLAPPVVKPGLGVHPTAFIDPSAKVGDKVRIGPMCVVGANVVLQDEVTLHAHVTVLDESVIGAGTELFSGVVIRERCTVGRRCILHPNVVIGADGFGYRPAPGGKGLLKITHIGSVTLGDEVEIGAGTCVDRGKFAATVIGDGCKIDNQCQIAHNCRLGRCVLLAGQVGLAGSVTVGDGVMMGGRVGVRDHVTIGAGAKIMGYAAVMNDIPAGETWGGYPAQEKRLALREHLAVRKLPDVMKKVEAILGDKVGDLFKPSAKDQQ